MAQVAPILPMKMVYAKFVELCMKSDATNAFRSTLEKHIGSWKIESKSTYRIFRTQFTDE